MRNFLLYLLIIIAFLSCGKKQKTEIDVSNINVDFSFKRFDKEFYTSPISKLPHLKKEYPLLFPDQVNDSVWGNKILNKEEQELFSETQKIYSNTDKLELNLELLFKHIKYYFSKFSPPKVITVQTNINYNDRIIYADSLLFISLDVYLGKNHEFYDSFPKYIKQNNTKEHIIVDVANSIINKQVMFNSSRTFISKMIYEGKKMYLLDAYLPTVSGKEKTGYSQEKIAWAESNEEEIWKSFIEKNLLFSTDTNLNKRFLDLAPFSKFYLSEDNKSPGQIGGWVGWQIVRSYMQNNDVSLPELLSTDAEIIFKKSKYKPRQ